jgi:hypothetical protein
MKKIVIIEKNSSLKDANVKKFKIETLYKKCKFKNNDNFGPRHTWKLNETTNITLFAKKTGRANSENKYELPPPLDKELFFGSMIICAHNDNTLTDENINNFNVESWEKIYEKLMGGFEDLGEEDGERSEDEEDIDPDDLDDNGYLKNSFLAADDESLGKEDDSEEEKEFSGAETESDGEFPESSDEESEPAPDSELDEENYEY